MPDDQKLKTIQAQMDESRDWLEFVLGEYFKWYAAFLILNIAAFAFAHTSGQPRLIAVRLRRLIWLELG